MKEKKTIVIIYEVTQIAEVLSHLERENISLQTCTLIPLEFEVEWELRKRGIPYESFLRYVPLEEEFRDVLVASQQAARRFHEHEAMQFYRYQGINLGEVFEPMLDMYLQHLGRHTALFKRIAEMCEIEKMIIPHSKRQLSSNAAALTSFEILAWVDAACAVGREKGFDIETIGAPISPIPTRKRQYIFRNLGRVGLALYNACISVFVRPLPLKIYASEYWPHIKSFIEIMDDVELVFMERSEIQNIPWRQLLKHRMRFLHPSAAITGGARRRMKEVVEEFSKQWQLAKSEIRETFSLVPSIDVWPVVERALTFLIKNETMRALVDIEGLRWVMERERPQKVLLRASIGGSAHHFFIATQIARQLGIPSIELQHAGAIVDPHSVHSRLTASYLASYGPLIGQAYHKNHGYALERLRAIGSPRFDHYVRERDSLAPDRAATLQKLGLDPEKPTVFAAVPFAGAFPLALSSYQVAEFLKAFRVAQKEMPGLQVIFKFRPNGLSSFHRDYIGELFEEGGVALTDTSNFLPLIIASDVAVTGRSTLMYEIMLGGRPMVLYPWLQWEKYDLELFNRAVPVAWNAKELSELVRQLLNKDEVEKAIERQKAFLSEHFSFDGHAPERMIDLLREKLLPLP